MHCLIMSGMPNCSCRHNRVRQAVTSAVDAFRQTTGLRSEQSGSCQGFFIFSHQPFVFAWDCAADQFTHPVLSLYTTAEQSETRTVNPCISIVLTET